MTSVADYEGWCRRVAMALQPDRWEDIAQEGMISIWQQIEAGHTNAGYLTAHAKYRMRKVAYANKSFGGDPRPGPRYRPRTVAVDWQDPQVLDALDVPQVDADPWAHPEIGPAISALPASDRDIVHDRFWRDNPWPSKVESSRWSKYIRPRLAASLA